MLTCQKEKFSIDPDITYLNGSYMSPLLKSAVKAGIKAIQSKSKPWNITTADFFTEANELKHLFAKMINVADHNRIAIVPSVSYAISNAARNIRFEKGDRIVLIDKIFPSNYFIWKKLADQFELELIMVNAPVDFTNRGAKWNDAILKAITPKTKVVALENIHWADGTRFEIKAISERSKEIGAKIIVDGTQGIGAYPFDQEAMQVDVLVAAGYKWLLGPYSIGMAYYGDAYDHGEPIEENWINKLGSENFETLTNYQSLDKPLAAKYSMGEQSQFVHAPMLKESMRQLLEWGVDNVQEYCRSIVDEMLPALIEKNIWIEESNYRANHIFGLHPPYEITASLKEKILSNKVYVSYRSQVIRVSPNIYNTADDLRKLIDLL